MATTAKRNTKRKSPAPRGREEVVRALLDAAGELFAAHGPAAVSVRDVASKAGVNHGLVHRHFGSKDQLVRAVMSDLAQQVAALAERQPNSDGHLHAAFAANAEQNAYWRVLARALLDGADLRELQEKFPMVEDMIKRAETAKREGRLATDADPRVLTAMSMAHGLGWLVFEPYLLTSTGLERRSKKQLRRQVFAVWNHVLQNDAD